MQQQLTRLQMITLRFCLAVPLHQNLMVFGGASWFLWTPSNQCHGFLSFGEMFLECVKAATLFQSVF